MFAWEREPYSDPISLTQAASLNASKSRPKNVHS